MNQSSNNLNLFSLCSLCSFVAISKAFLRLILTLGLLLCVSCRTAHPLPPADFASPGWRLRQGQAVWRPSKSRPELAGDLLLAVNANGNYVIQFSKTPFTLATAQVADGRWQIELARHFWRGKGAPPKRFVWFQLAPALDGALARAPWRFANQPNQSWRLDNAGTGEFLEGQFFP
jgi:hypothetical protein